MIMTTMTKESTGEIKINNAKTQTLMMVMNVVFLDSHSQLDIS